MEIKNLFYISTVISSLCAILLIPPPYSPVKRASIEGTTLTLCESNYTTRQRMIIASRRGKNLLGTMVNGASRDHYIFRVSKSEKDTTLESVSIDGENPSTFKQNQIPQEQQQLFYEYASQFQ